MMTRKQRGLALSAILLVVLLLAAVAIAIAVSGRSIDGSSSSQKNRLLASTIIQQGDYIRGAITDWPDPDTLESITFDENPTTGLFYPPRGLVAMQYPPRAAMAAYGVVSLPATVSWANMPDLNHTYGVTRSPHSHEYAISLSYLTLEVCQQINSLLTGSTAIPNSNAVPSEYQNNNYAFLNVSNGAPAACVHDNDSDYDYYVIVIDN